jgi:DNA integrity scanning protein DisA with diadenylate cyclase activity
MKAFKMRLEGLTVPEIAEEMGVARRTAYLYIKIAKRDIKSGKLTSVQIRELGQLADPINLQRKRLTRRLRKSDEVIGMSMEDYHKDDKYARNATKTALAINKGLGVLQEETVVKKFSFEEKRLLISAQLGLVEQYGGSVSQEIKAEIVKDEKDD